MVFVLTIKTIYIENISNSRKQLKNRNKKTNKIINFLFKI